MGKAAIGVSRSTRRLELDAVIRCHSVEWLL